MDHLVECYSGSEYAEYPLSFQSEGLCLKVEEILERRRTPSGKTFRVRAADDQIYALHYNEAGDKWQVEAL